MTRDFDPDEWEPPVKNPRVPDDLQPSHPILQKANDYGPTIFTIIVFACLAAIVLSCTLLGLKEIWENILS